jgi:UDP-2-acetamido-3-amino-2,3-dideoxy-glucuronate N-acetyltransferase
MIDLDMRIGVIGAGYWGSNLVRVCSQLGVLDSVCDSDESVRANIHQSYPAVDTLVDVDAIFSRQIDAVVIATPAQTHASLCLSALRAGKHVFVEKPLALSVSEGEKIVKAAETAGRTVFVGHLLLYHPAVRKLRSLLAEGSIGRVWHLRSRRLSLGKLRAYESVWWSFAPHDVAVMLAVMGDLPRAVVAAQSSRGGGLADVAYADFEFAGGRSAHLEVCWLDPERSARLDVFGDAGALTLADARTGSVLTRKQFSTTTDGSGGPVVTRGEESPVPFDDEEPLKAEVRAFIECVRTGKPSESSARDGVAVLEALAMADEASAKRPELRALA